VCRVLHSLAHRQYLQAISKNHHHDLLQLVGDQLLGKALVTAGVDMVYGSVAAGTITRGRVMLTDL
jgi:hypothetical protein